MSEEPPASVSSAVGGGGSGEGEGSGAGGDEEQKPTCPNDACARVLTIDEIRSGSCSGCGARLVERSIKRQLLCLVVITLVFFAIAFGVAFLITYLVKRQDDPTIPPPNNRTDDEKRKLDCQVFNASAWSAGPCVSANGNCGPGKRNVSRTLKIIGKECPQTEYLEDCTNKACCEDGWTALLMENHPFCYQVLKEKYDGTEAKSECSAQSSAQILVVVNNTQLQLLSQSFDEFWVGTAPGVKHPYMARYGSDQLKNLRLPKEDTELQHQYMRWAKDEPSKLTGEICIYAKKKESGETAFYSRNCSIDANVVCMKHSG